MKKQLISFLAVVILLFHICVPSFASSMPVENQLNANMMQYLLDGNAKELLRRENYSYILLMQKLYKEKYIPLLIELTNTYVGTGSIYYIEPAFYANVLVCIMALSEAEDASAIAAQNKHDNLKGIKEYAMDFVSMASDTVGIICGTSKNLCGLLDEIAFAIDGIATTIESTDQSLEAFSNLQTVLQNYDRFQVFLSAVESQSEGNLKLAAQTLKSGMRKAMEVKLNSYANVLDQNTDNLKEFFFSNIFMEMLKEIPDYETDDTLRCFVDWGGGAIASVGVLLASYDLGSNIGKCIGNLTVGGEDLITRLREMAALYSIHRAVVDEMTTTFTNFLSVYNVETADELNKSVYKYTDLARYLKVCDIRGEYCLTRIVTKDAKLLSWFNKRNAEEAEQWYYVHSDGLKIMHAKLQSILYKDIVDNRFDNDFDTTPDYSLYVPVIEKAIAERPYSGDDYGILNDLDKDGVEELFMLHTYSGGAIPEMGYSIYDINDGALVTRAEKQTLIVMAGGGGCMAGISETDGGTYFYSYSLQIGDVYADSVITVYDQSFSVYKTFEANMETEGTHITQDPYTTSYSIDGNPCTEAEYKLLLFAMFPFDTDYFQLENAERQNGLFYNGQWYGETLTALLNRLKAPSEQTDQYQPKEIENKTQNSVDSAVLVGTWELDLEKTTLASGAPIREILGSAYKGGSSMEINADGSFNYCAGFLGGDGTWQATENGLAYQIATFDEGNVENGELRLEDDFLIMLYFDYQLCWVKKSG